MRAKIWMPALLFVSHLVATATVFGQAVQLPTIHNTGVSTTVLVPDRGSMLLGGINRSSSGSVTSGVPGLSHIPGANRLFKNRAIGSSSGAMNMSVNVFVHDLREMDEALLAEAAARRGGAALPVGRAAPAPLTAEDRRAAFLTQHVGRTADLREETNAAPLAAAKVASVDEIRREQLAAKTQQENEARSYLAQGLEAESLGQFGAAKVFYNMAARRSAGELRSTILARLQNLSPTANATKLAAESR